jgi:hypothetical protein
MKCDDGELEAVEDSLRRWLDRFFAVLGLNQVAARHSSRT